MSENKKFVELLEQTTDYLMMDSGSVDPPMRRDDCKQIAPDYLGMGHINSSLEMEWTALSRNDQDKILKSWAPQHFG